MRILTTCTLFVTLTGAALRAQDWNTAGYDAQRTSWVRSEAQITPQSMQQPGFRFIFKRQVDNETRGGYALSQAMVLSSYIGYRGFRGYAFVSGAAGTVTALDFDIGKVEWSKRFPSTPATATCPGTTAGLTRPVSLTPGAGRGPGRRTAAQSGVGEPGEGAIQLAQANGGRGGRGPAPAAPAGGRGATGASGNPAAGRGNAGGRGPANPLARVASVYALAGDGNFHMLQVSNGDDATAPIPFVPADSRAEGLIFTGDIAYVTTRSGCGTAPNAVWSLDPTTKAVSTWKTNGGALAGNMGVALGPDGTVYAATGDGDYGPANYSDSVVALEARTLKMRDFFTPGKAAFNSTPTVFTMAGRTLVAATNRDGRLYLLDGVSPGGSDHKTPLAVSTQYSAGLADAGALATWEDAAGARWILASADGPANITNFPVRNGRVTDGSIVAFKVSEQAGKFALTPAWISREMTAPMTPIIVNGVVFAVAGGGTTSTPVLYALDATTGKDIWNSGNMITAPVRSGGLSVGPGQIFLSTTQNDLYSFGFPLQVLP